MKTFILNRVVLAGLAAVLTSSAASADDVGIVRLGRGASAAASRGTDEGVVVVRGQSTHCPPSTPGPLGLLHLFSQKPAWVSGGTDGGGCENITCSEVCAGFECAPACECESCDCCQCTPSCDCAPCDCCGCGAGCELQESCETAAWYESAEVSQNTSSLELSPEADLSFAFLEPCTGSEFLESFLGPYSGAGLPQSFLEQCGGDDVVSGSWDRSIGDAGGIDQAGCYQDDCDGLCDECCLPGCDTCDVGCNNSFFGHTGSRSGGFGSLVCNLFGCETDGADFYVSSSQGAGKCAECNGRGCHRCRRQARHTSRRDSSRRRGRCPHGHMGGHCPICGSHAFINNNRIACFLSGQAAMYRARKRVANAGLNAYLRCKLGYFIHDGCGGVGCKPFGHYSIVYPDNPAYFDGRDGQIYAAQGFGGPVSVPLAPNVRHAYNYGWGVPSSRLTPISHSVY